MHFSVLLTVQTPELEPNPIVDMFIEERVEKLKSEHKKQKRDIWRDLAIERLNGMRTEFSRCVMAQVYDKMEPYCEQTENPEFLEFEDNTEAFINLTIMPEDDWCPITDITLFRNGKELTHNTSMDSKYEGLWEIEFEGIKYIVEIMKGE